MALAVVLVLLCLVLAVVLLRARREAAAARAQRRADAERHGQERDRLQRTLDRHRQALAHLQQSWRAERAWSRELRSQISHLDAERHDQRDVRELVLAAAIALSEADRGLLLAREDDDADGDLDMVVSQGFRHDPRHSAVAQRFARKVLERDQIVREDDPTAGGGTPAEADDEISSLVAIPVFLRDRFHGVVVCANRDGGFDDVDDDVFLALGDHAGAALHHGMLRHQLQDAGRAVVRTLVETVAVADPLLHLESARLVVHAISLGREMDLDAHERDVLVCSVLLRSLGHVGLPGELLLEPGPLSPEDRALVELHPRIGFTIINQAPSLRDVASTVLHHHERWDGRGYPAGLAGEAVPRTARALAVLETYGALIHPRPYREARSAEEACRELVAVAGSQLDPEIAHLLVEQVRRMPGQPSDVLAQGVLEALPIDPALSAAQPLGPLDAPSTDGLTLLGDQRALQRALQDAVSDASADGRRPFALVLLGLEDLARLNEEAGFVVGDRLVRLAARTAKRAAARLGGTAFRVGGRRLAVLVPTPDGDRAAAEVAREFTGGPRTRQAVVTWTAGERPEELLARARDALDSVRDAGAPRG